MRKLNFILCLSLVALLAGGTMARANSVNVTFENGGSVVSHDGTVYVGPYHLTISSQTTTAPCDDYFDEVFNGETWKANLLPLTATGVSSALFGADPNADRLYLEAAYLTEQFQAHGPSYENDISYAIWGIFDAAALSSPNYDVGAAGFRSAADGASLNFSQFAGWEILTPIKGTQPQYDGRPQEFIVPSKTPEPGTLLLLGTGLLGAGGILRRLRA